MWCVIQVFTGYEQRIRHACEKYIDRDVLEEAFIPMYVRRRKYSGAWKDEKVALIPGYVFLITERPNDLLIQLNKVVGMTKLLRNSSNILTLTDQEEYLMRKLGGEKHITEMSFGCIVGDKITINDGPLVGFEGMIKKIDRHKRQCIVETDMFGQKIHMTVGLEIVSKS